ncbi:terminase [Brevibacillus laterosporus]|uniref:terminase n=1 Tax=Brevibacillus laterosporus TaxID=1465 RepID=UPI000CE557D8|nr:terminase [Brevibacillus laterosporus]MED1664548.1 HK97 gp10 family phage protein [Brevibacillus laterosporus]MED1669964.1 HK97 gp10 family phage protein [Brevibacillus laterosporus]MED1717293.1 HK97 gp10 family phage protein [Brevibacillus laterosporus]PPA82344.1 terminase [Brevibacillus laterosporus]
MDFYQLQKRLRMLHDKDIKRIEKKIIRRIGTVFLRMLRQQIKKMGLVDSGESMKAFMKGKRGNVWIMDVDRNSFTLELGASYFVPSLLNDGYTIKKGHFVPGHFEGSKFVHDRNAKTGVWMKPRSFIGKNYLDITLQDFQGGIQGLMEDLLSKELKKVLG